MARLYTNENVPAEVVRELRRLGHDVLTSYEAGNANAAIADEGVLEFALSESRLVVANNRRDFIRLHRTGVGHLGIVVFTSSPDPIGIAARINSALADGQAVGRFLARVDGIGFRFDPT